MKIESQVSWLEAPYDLKFKVELLDTDNLVDDEICCESIISAISPGTEVAAYTGMPPLRPGKVYPRLVGYCHVSKVIATGKNVKNIKIGDRVLTGSCHRSHFIMKESDIMAKIPDSLSSEHAACTYLYHLGYDAVLKSSIQYGSPIVIIGLGVLGLAAIEVASNAGASVYAVSEHDRCHKVGLKLGAKGVYTRAEKDKLKDALGQRLADSIITTTNSWDDWQTALQFAGRNGMICVMGFPGRGIDNIPFNPLDSQYFYDKQLRIQAVGMAPSELDSRQFLKFNEKNNIHFLMDQIKLKKLNPENLITDKLAWHQLEDAYQSLLSRKNSPITYLLQWKN
jgi:2-desacetyl-2-hydroxyethyl bacteriochlorophyllide A dehydrogenase